MKALLSVLLLAFGAYVSGDWTYTVTDNQATITAYSGDDTEVVIPAELDGIAVVKVEEDAFKDNHSISSINIPVGVERIGKDAFRGCDSLTNITVDTDNLNYSSVDGVLFSKLQTSLIAYSVAKLDTYIIPERVTSIGAYAFASCTNLTSIIIRLNIRTCLRTPITV